MNQLTFTTAGHQRLATAIATGVPLRLAHIAVGSGDGANLTPATEIIDQEIFRFPIHRQFADQLDLVVEGIISEDRGPFTIRCMGVFDAFGVLIAYASTGEVYKPAMSDGMGASLNVRAALRFSDPADMVHVEIVSTIGFASQAEAEEGVKNDVVMTPLRVRQAAPFLGLLVHGGAHGVNGLTGGIGYLDGVPTLDIGPALWAVDDPVHGWGIWELIPVWKLPPDAADEAPGAVVKPLDFDPSENEKVWLRRL